MPYTRRRERLGDLGLDEDPVRTPPWYPGGAADVLAVRVAHGLEGVVGKPLASAYHPGQRRDWVKVKNLRHTEVIIAGWTPGQGRRADTIGSLLPGVWDGDRLRYAGHVGTGFTQAMLTDLMRRLEPLRRDTSPFDPPVPARHAHGAQWKEPWLVGEVAFTEWTGQRGHAPPELARAAHRQGSRPFAPERLNCRAAGKPGLDAQAGWPGTSRALASPTETPQVRDTAADPHRNPTDETAHSGTLVMHVKGTENSR